jgi:tRNA nucleotidyltransferase/poly(A) polymerase
MSTRERVNAEMAKIVESLRLQMFAKKMSGLEQLNAAFQQVDWSGAGTVSRQLLLLLLLLLNAKT